MLGGRIIPRCLNSTLRLILIAEGKLLSEWSDSMVSTLSVWSKLILLMNLHYVLKAM